MRAGRLDRRVAVQRFTVTPSDSGELIETWDTIGAIDRWASKAPVTGEERFGSQQLEAKEQIEFRLRWSNDLADLQPTDRIIEPAADAADLPTPGRSTYDIIAVLEINRREGLRILATRRLGTPGEVADIVRRGDAAAAGIGQISGVGEALVFSPFGVGAAAGIGAAQAVGSVAVTAASGVGVTTGVGAAAAVGAMIKAAAGAAAGVGAAVASQADVHSGNAVAAGTGASAVVGAIAWVDDFITPSGVAPSLVLDFVNNRYYDGSTGTASAASLVNNTSGKIDGTGLTIGGATNLTSNGAFTTAVQQSAGTVWAEISDGDGANGAIVGFTTGAPDGPILMDGGSALGAVTPFCWPTYLRTNNAVATATPAAGIGRVVSGWDGAGRRIVFNRNYSQNGGAVTPTEDAVVYSARGQAILGSWNSGGLIYSGKIRKIVMWPSKLSNDDMLAVTWPFKYLLPMRKSHMIKNVGTQGGGGYATIGAGLLQFERTQPWTLNCEVIKITADSVIFTNVNSLGPPWFGWEVWLPSSGVVRVHLLSGWPQTVGTHSLQVNSTNILDSFKSYRLQVTYDGSSVSSGVKIYINGVLETNVVDHDTLDASIINGTHQMYIDDQLPGNLFGGSWLGAFAISNVVRDATYAAAAAASERLPPPDANHVLYFDMSEGSGTTLHDRSSSGYNGTLTGTPGTNDPWNIW